MIEFIISILLVGIGLVIGYFMRKKVYEAELERAQQTATHIISKAEKELGKGASQRTKIEKMANV